MFCLPKLEKGRGPELFSCFLDPPSKGDDSNSVGGWFWVILE